jgi:hypothetical protein
MSVLKTTVINGTEYTDAYWVVWVIGNIQPHNKVASIIYAVFENSDAQAAGAAPLAYSYVDVTDPETFDSYFGQIHLGSDQALMKSIEGLIVTNVNLGSLPLGVGATQYVDAISIGSSYSFGTPRLVIVGEPGAITSAEGFGAPTAI